mgnify:CR=1 FL=1
MVFSCRMQKTKDMGHSQGLTFEATGLDTLLFTPNALRLTGETQ